MKNNEKKVYTAPALELLRVDTSDVITTSPTTFVGLELPLAEENSSSEE